MKTQILVLISSLLLLGISFDSLAQCDLTDLTIVKTVSSSNDESCTLNVTVSFSIEKNAGNKYTYVHLWTQSDYPAFDYKKAPDKSDLRNVLATVAICTNGPAKLLQTYGPDNTVPTLYNGVTLTEETMDDKIFKITISNLIIHYPGSCDELHALKGDIWSTQSEADKHPPVHCVSTTLPVNLIKFKGELLDNAIALSWVTTDEKGSRHFEIERSKNLLEFIGIGTVKSAGTTTVLQNYNFVDRAPDQGANYYRLRMTDLDGTSVISKIIVVKNNTDSVVFQLLGNPSTNNEIKFIMKNADFKNLSFFDLNGNRLGCRIIQFGSFGTLKPTAHLQPGVYLLRLNDTITMTRKVLMLPD